MSVEELKVSIRSGTNHFSRFYRIVSRVAERAGLDADEQFRFTVSLSEAYTNAYLHGNRKDPRKKVHLHFSWDDTRVEVVVEDEGEGKVLWHELEASRPDILPEKSGGRGVGIMKQYADNVKIETRAEGGLRVRITFLLSDKQQPRLLLHKPEGGSHGDSSNGEF